jgi:hypothetical protein
LSGTGIYALFASLLFITNWGQFAMSIMTWADSIVEVGTGEANHNVQQGAIETTSSGICRQSGACPECGQRTQVARDV